MTEINHLQKLQNFAACIVAGSKFDSHGLPLINRLGSYIIVFKSLHELVPEYMCNLFTRTPCDRLTD